MNIAEELRKLADRIDAPDPYAELKKAHAEGRVIQQSDGSDCYDFTLTAPCWSDLPENYRIKPEEPWTLGREIPGFRALRDGEEWSRQDFSKEMLEGGWRPCLKGENMQPGDESGECYEKPEGSGPKRWVSVKGLLQTSAHMRTKRPLPILSASQIAEGWKEHTGGENPAPGKRCQVILHSGTVTKVEPSQIWGWAKTGQPWGIAAYRIIEPRLVPLGPEDVPILSVLRYIRNPSDEYAITSKVAGELKSYVMGWTYSTLMGNMEINRSTPITGKWDASAWEPCHKEAAQ